MGVNLLIMYLYIALSASQCDTLSTVTDEDLSFPSSEDLANYTSFITPILANIPTDLITEKLNNSLCKWNSVLTKVHHIEPNFVSKTTQGK